MSLIFKMTRDAVEPEVERPDPEIVLAGDPVYTTWSFEETEDGLYSGIWQTTPGKWLIDYSEWEYVHILEGVSVLTGEDGTSVTLRAGDAWIIRPGFKGTWECVETTLKEYVIRA